MEVTLPILGILIGWMLKEFSSAYQASVQDRKTIAKTVSTLLFIYSEMENIFAFERAVAQAPLPDERMRELFRQRAFEKYTTPPDKIDAEFGNALAVIAEYDPLLAIELRLLRERFDFYKKVKFTNISAMPEIYSMMTELGRNASTAYLVKFESNITRFALNHSIALWFRVWLNFKNKKDRAKSANASFDKFFNEITNQVTASFENIR